LNQPDVARLRLCLPGHKISKVVGGAYVDRLDCYVEVVHPAESGTRNDTPDTMVMT
jgi:hypothetical protein